jgi:hypothetical protein
LRREKTGTHLRMKKLEFEAEALEEGERVCAGAHSLRAKPVQSVAGFVAELPVKRIQTALMVVDEPEQRRPSGPLIQWSTTQRSGLADWRPGLLKVQR